MKTAEYESWQSDAAHLAINQWIGAWREEHGKDDRPPSLTFARHLGREAVAMQTEGVTRLEMQRTFAALGRAGVCICDLPAETNPKLIDRKEAS